MTAERVGAYFRQSLDREGDEAAIERQETEVAQLAARLGVTIAERYVDNNKSATSGAPRPAYDAMVDDAQAGRVTMVLCQDIDRMTRRVREGEDLIDVHDETGIRFVFANGVVTEINRENKLMVRIGVAMAAGEIEKKSARQRRGRKQAVKRGSVHGGGKRAFGYESGGLVVVETEAEIIRETARRVLTGESIRSISTDLAQRGVVGSTGRPMTPTTIRQWITSPRISGRRGHLPKDGKPRTAIVPVAHHDDGSDVRAVWPEIISVEESDRIRALLADPARTSNHSHGRKHLLSGILSCGSCGRPMLARTQRQGNSPIRAKAYACDQIIDGPRCRKSIVALPVEDEVRARVLARIDSADFEKRLHHKLGIDPKLVAQRDRDRAKLVDLGKQYDDDEIDVDEYRQRRDRLTGRIADVDRLVTRAARADALSLLTGTGEIEQRWDRLNLSQQRSVLGALVDAIRINPATKLGCKFDPTRVEIDFAI